MSGGIKPLIIISGPSGAGKSTVVHRLMRVSPIPLKRSVSATTRAPRPGEVDGVDYHFLSREEFDRGRHDGQFLECKEVFGCGDWYGTLRAEVTSGHAEGKWVLLEIDVAGAQSVLAEVPGALTIFLHPGSSEELERRLRNRGTETDSSLARRLQVARAEMACVGQYEYEVVNDSLERAVTEICDILERRGGSAHA